MRGRGGTKGKKFRRKGPTHKHTQTVVVHSKNAVPPRLRTHLCYAVNKTLNNVGGTAIGARFTPTFAYDVDPVLGSTSMPFFQELYASTTTANGMYRAYRCNWSEMTVYATNKEVFPITMILCPINFDPGATGSNTSTVMSEPQSKIYPMGPLTGNSSVVGKIFGTTEVEGGIKYTEQIDTYTGIGTTAPNENFYMFVGFITDNTAVFSAGVNVVIRLKNNYDFCEWSLSST